ncbi:MAG: lytic transglycosylase domain-containing protein [Curvibacter lanceolatus]|uniref:lytic transglycosylase domain-containing protein n=1 Tax=Curvibacter lanceolatus TaxID=86182 RepID=UPI00235697F7|nr:lytic transglycosylase domain-containing protein [Curvibacter lanceolatus]MBV5290993.1 lytic transglycosylase domain-containing protein [Curvibacter lanceolatus]
MRSRSTSEPRRLARLLLIALGLAAGWLAPARAEVWGYVDAHGTPHFAAERQDDRYELFYRGNAAQEGEPARADTPRAVAVPTLQPRLLAFFEVSPGYKRVKLQMREAAQLHRVDFELLQALIATESGFDANAVSPRGAVGLMQVMPPTAEQYGVLGDARQPIEKRLTDPRVNLQAGTRYLRHLLDLFDNRLELALAAYNAGVSAVQRAGQQVPNIRETQNYVRTVTQLYALLKPPPQVLEQRRSQARPRLEWLPVPGGAIGRANMIEPRLSPGLNELSFAPPQPSAIETP